MSCILSLLSCISAKDIEDFTYWQIMYQEDMSFHINPPAHLQAGNDMCISLSSFYFPCVHEQYMYMYMYNVILILGLTYGLRNVL